MKMARLERDRLSSEAPLQAAGRIPPQALEAELSVLGAMLLEKEAIGRATEVLEPSSFYRDTHRKIFEAMTALYERNETADLITVREELRKRGHLEAVGGATFLSQLLDQVPTAANIEYHSKLVLEKATLRKLIEVATEIVQKGYEASEDSGQIIDRAEELIFSINDPRLKRGFIPLKNLLSEAVEMIQEISDNKRPVTGVPSGFHDLDKMTAGFQKSDLIVIAGRPSMGKTSLALNVAEYVAVDQNHPVGIFSLEMSREQLVMRLLSGRAGIPSHRLRTGYLRQEEWKALTEAAGALSRAPIFIDDTPAISVMEMRAKARRLKNEFGCELIVMDYLQLARGYHNPESRQQEISQISRSLKALAKELSVPIIALSQLSRAVEQREDKRPMLADLRESGAIEQDADLVIFIFREEFYRPNKEDARGMAEIIVGKHRNGPTGRVQLAFLGELARFSSLETQREEVF
jgi:replicative DNA helicase